MLAEIRTMDFQQNPINFHHVATSRTNYKAFD